MRRNGRRMYVAPAAGKKLDYQPTYTGAETRIEYREAPIWRFLQLSNGERRAQCWEPGSTIHKRRGRV